MAVEPISKWEDVSYKTVRMWGTLRSSRTALVSAAWEHIWGRDTITIQGVVHSRKGFHFFPGTQWEPQRDLSRGCLLSALFEKAVPALAVRGPRQWLRGVGGGREPTRMDWRVLGVDLEEGCGQERRRAKRLELAVRKVDGWDPQPFILTGWS